MSKSHEWRELEEFFSDVQSIPSSSDSAMLNDTASNSFLAEHQLYDNAILVSSDEEELTSRTSLDKKGKSTVRNYSSKREYHGSQRSNKEQKAAKERSSNDRISEKKRENDNHKREWENLKRDRNVGKSKLSEIQIAQIAEYDDFDLDAVVEELLRPTKRPFVERQASIPLDLKCPICFRSYQRHEMERHASGCTGGYSDTETDRPPNKAIRKNTIASSVAKHEAKRKRNHTSFVGNVNYYVESEDLLGSNGHGLNEEVTTNLTWESKGQTRFS